MNFLFYIFISWCLFSVKSARLKKKFDSSIVSISSNFYDDIINQHSNSYEEQYISECRYGSQKYRPNKKNCNQFFICNTSNHNRPTIQKVSEIVGVCPPNTWFDTIHSDNDEVICTHFEIICATEYTEMYNYCNCKTIRPALGIITVQQANTETDEHLKEQNSISCIADNEFHLFESENDCERYFICFNTNVYPMQCKPGLHFNPVMKYCDVPEKAQCKIKDRECPPTGMSLLAHPHNCNSFYYCYFGKKTLQTCEFYYVWDDESKSCVRQDQVTCHLNKLN